LVSLQKQVITPTKINLTIITIRRSVDVQPQKVRSTRLKSVDFQTEVNRIIGLIFLRRDAARIGVA
jgi:hypothetical protein